MDDALGRILDKAEENISPEEILDAVLTEADKEALHDIKGELSICIKWGAVTSQILQSLLDDLDTLVFLETGEERGGLVKLTPYESLFVPDQARINSSSEKSRLCRKYVLLNLLKKLLGALKTRVNQELNSIEIIDEETELELKALLAEDPDEEEMDLVGRKKPDREEREIIAQVDVGEDRGCEHKRLTIRQVRADDSHSGLDEMHSYCKDCRQVIRMQVLGTKTPKRESWFSRPRQCLHQQVHWKEGLEGQVAECAHCGQEVSDPKKYQWTKVGLEPFGDKPEDDEIMSFPAGQKEVAV